MTERDIRIMLLIFTLVALFLPAPDPAFVLLLYFGEFGGLNLFPALTLTSMDDVMFLISVELPLRMLVLTLPILVVMNLCLANFTHPWLKKFYRALLFVLWGSFLVLLPRDWARMYIIPVVLVVATVAELVLVRQEHLSHKNV